MDCSLNSYSDELKHVVFPTREKNPLVSYFTGRYSIVCLYGHTCSNGKDQPGKVANPARGQLNREHQ